MAKVTSQNIPSDLYKGYTTALSKPREFKTQEIAQKRTPFFLPTMRDTNPAGPSPSQAVVRKAFKKCCKCFNVQPDTGGAVPPATGPRGRDWWYDESAGSGLFYYDFFMKQTLPVFLADTMPTWCITKSVHAPQHRGFELGVEYPSRWSDDGEEYGSLARIQSGGFKEYGAMGFKYGGTVDAEFGSAYLKVWCDGLSSPPPADSGAIKIYTLNTNMVNIDYMTDAELQATFTKLIASYTFGHLTVGGYVYFDVTEYINLIRGGATDYGILFYVPNTASGKAYFELAVGTHQATFLIQD
jgi:hypothetical protein